MLKEEVAYKPINVTKAVKFRIPCMENNKSEEENVNET
jgi:hypothetical protein